MARSTKNSKLHIDCTNICGGSDTKTVAVALKGSIEPIPAVLLRSVFFPTDYPTKKNPEVGLVRSQQKTLTSLLLGSNTILSMTQSQAVLGMRTRTSAVLGVTNQGLSELRLSTSRNSWFRKESPQNKIDTSPMR